jgi:adenylyl- and sulfurtransferase ThiI
MAIKVRGWPNAVRIAVDDAFDPVAIIVVARSGIAAHFCCCASKNYATSKQNRLKHAHLMFASGG